MDKILKAEGIGERQFSEATAAALLSMNNPQWSFVRNVTPKSNADTNTSTGKTEDNPKPQGEGISSASAGKGKSSRKANTTEESGGK